MVISAGVEPALTGWKPVVLTVILRDQFRNVLLYYNRFKKIGNSYFYENLSFHGSVLNQVNLLFFQAQNLTKIILLLFDSSKSDPLYNQSSQMAHAA